MYIRATGYTERRLLLVYSLSITYMGEEEEAGSVLMPHQRGAGCTRGGTNPCCQPTEAVPRGRRQIPLRGGAALTTGPQQLVPMRRVSLCVLLSSCWPRRRPGSRHVTAHHTRHVTPDGRPVPLSARSLLAARGCSSLLTGIYSLILCRQSRRRRRRGGFSDAPKWHRVC
jgi:hypothetical protein